MIGAGKRNVLIDIERASDVADGAGGFVRSWGQIARAWAKATPTGGKEALIAGTLQASQSWRVELLWRRDISTSDRFVLNGRPLNIQSIEDVDGTRATLVALCSTDGAA